MPRPMKVKMFMDAKPDELEKQINAWLAGLGSAAIVKTETAVAPTAELSNASCIVVTIWYEPPEKD